MPDAMPNAKFKPKGAHQTNRLSAAFVKSAPPGKHGDGNGLFLLVEESGSRRWGQRLTVHGKQRELGLGSPPLVSLAQARQVALDNRRVARSGGDPIKAKRLEREEAKSVLQIPKFSEAIDGALEKYGPEMSSERHRKQWRASLELYAVPAFGNLKVDEVTTNHVFSVLEPIWLDKTDTARRLRGRIEKVLLWATGQGFRTGENPARWKGNLELRLPKPTAVSKVTHRPAVSLADLADWFADLRKRKGNASRALEFAALTAARSGEVRGMSWSELDLDRALWIVPASRMKMDREHRVPLSSQALALLSGIERQSGSDFVFSAPRGGALSDMALSATMKRIHSSALRKGGVGYVDRASGRPAVPHGLRSTFRDWVAECTSYPGEMAEVALAHKVANNVEAAYRRGDQLEKRRQMMGAWAAFLTGSQDQKIIGIEVRRG